MEHFSTRPWRGQPAHRLPSLSSMRLLILAALWATALNVPAAAQCSRPIIVPAVASGQSVIFHDGQASGVVPEMLAQVGQRAGCIFRWSVVPRMRLEALFETGGADLLVAATQVARRDRYGIFVPVVEARPALISLRSSRAPVGTIAELLARRELRVALVRGYDYGDAYQAMITELKAQGRVYFESDPTTVARLINGSMADVTIMPANTFAGGLHEDPRTAGMAGKLRIEQLAELPWIKTGIYISRKSLSRADQLVLETALAESVKSGAWWHSLTRQYTAPVLEQHARPLPSSR